MLLIYLFGYASVPVGLYANPTGGTVVAGGASFDQSGSTLTVTTSTDRSIINWQDFSIDRGELTRFLQPSSSSAVLNRVVSGNPSNILGTLQSNGQVFLINPNGITVGAGAVIDTAGFIASTLNVKDEDFVKGGDQVFKGDSTAKIRNEGTIRALDGDVFLIAREVENLGKIEAPKGTVGLAGGTEVLIAREGDERVFVKATSASGAVMNTGQIAAVRAEMKAAGGNEYAMAVNNGGSVRATGMVRGENGSVRLVSNQGLVKNSGLISSRNGNGTGGHVRMEGTRTLNEGVIDASGVVGGTIYLLGEEVGLMSGSTVQAMGDSGGGEILVGGDYLGKNPNIRRAKSVYMDENAFVDASAIADGKGGKVILWSDDYTGFYGTIRATGAGAGTGGFIETSSHNNLQVYGLGIAGIGGEWLLDPYDVTIAAATANGSFSGANPNVWTPSANSSTINVATINSSLSAGTSVTITTTGAGVQAGNILVSSAISKTAGGAATLILNANGSITVNQTIGTSSGNLNVSLVAGTGVTTSAAITTLGGNLSVSGTTISLGAATVGGTLGVTSTGAITQTGALVITGTTTLASGAANNITLSNAGNNFSTVGITTGNNVALTDSNALILGTSTVSGTYGVTTSGAITQSGALTVTGVSTLAAGAANDITLSTSTNNFSTVGVTSGRNVTLRDAGAIILGASTVSGTLGVTSVGTITQTGALAVTGITTLAAGTTGDITLSTAANNFSTVGITTGRNVLLTDSNALILGASTVSGTLGVTTTGAITQSGTLTVTGVSTLAVGAANDITLSTSTNNFSTIGVTSGRNVTLRDAGAMILGASTVSGTLGVTTVGALTQTGALVVTGVTTLAAGTTGDITLSTSTNNFSTVGVTSGRNVTLRDSGTIILGASTVSGTLGVTSVGAITQTGALTVTGVTTLAAGTTGDITLSTATNNFSTVGVTTGRNVLLTDSNALILGTSTVSGTYGVTTTGAITQSGALTVTGVTTLAAGAANDITLSTTTNNFSTVGITTGRNVTLRDSGTIILGASTVSGTLGVTSVGAITQTGALTVTGVTTLAAGTTGDITLSTATNNFSTVGVTTGRNVLLTDSNALILGTSTVSGTLGVTTTGAITQSGALTVTGVTTLAAGAANDITLSTTTNNFSTIGITSGRNVILRDAGAMILGASTVSGTLGVTTAGALTQTGALAVTGVTTLAAGTTGDITLSTTTNNFSTVGITTGRNVTLRDSGTIILGASTVSGTLGVTSVGAITQTGALTVTGVTTLAAGTTGDITLSTTTNNFSTVGITSGRNVNLVDANAIALGASTVSGTLAVTATTASISNTGALVVTGNSTFTANAASADIIIGNAGNNFTGTVAFVGSGGLRNITISDTTALALGAQTLTGNLSVTSGALTQTGVLVIAGTTTLASGTANDITLNNASNNFGTVAITSGRNVLLADINTLAFGASTVTGTLGVTTAGAITQSGAMTVSGISTLAVGTGNDITLSTSTNNFSTVGVTSGRNVTLRDAGAIILGASTVSGTLGVTSVGAITQSGALTVTGVTTLAAGTTGDITLSTATNNFSAVGVTSGRNVTLRDSGAIILGASTVSGTFALTSAGSVTQSGALVVAGVSTFAAGATNDITLSTATNNFSTVGITTGRNVLLTDSNALILGASTVSGTLGVTTTGAITQSGTLTVTGVSTLAAGVANDITLSTATNNFSTLGVTSGLNVLLANSNALILAASTVSGTLGVATVGAITQSGALTVTGATTLAAGVGNNITLSTVTNNFSTVGIISGNNVLLTDSNALVLGASTVNGTLGVTASGSLTQSGALAVTGLTTLAVGAGNDIALNHVANNFSAVGVTSGRNVLLADSNALILGASTVSGTLGVATSGAITQSGALVVTGATTMEAGAVNNITLSTSTNNFNTIGIISANQVTLMDRNAIDLGASTVSGTLNLNAGGAVTDSGNLSINRLTASSGGAITLDASSITIGSIGNVSRAGALYIGNTGTNLTVDGVWSGSNTANDITLLTGGDLTLASGASMISTGTGNLVLSTTGDFKNLVGPAVLSVAAGRFLVYSVSDQTVNKGGIASTDLYSKTYALNPPGTVEPGNHFVFQFLQGLTGPPLPPSPVPPPSNTVNFAGAPVNLVEVNGLPAMQGTMGLVEIGGVKQLVFEGQTSTAGIMDYSFRQSYDPISMTQTSSLVTSDLDSPSIRTKRTEG